MRSRNGWAALLAAAVILGQGQNVPAAAQEEARETAAGSQEETGTERAAVGIQGELPEETAGETESGLSEGQRKARIKVVSITGNQLTYYEMETEEETEARTEESEPGGESEEEPGTETGGGLEAEPGGESAAEAAPGAEPGSGGRPEGMDFSQMADGEQPEGIAPTQMGSGAVPEGIASTQMGSGTVPEGIAPTQMGDGSMPGSFGSGRMRNVSAEGEGSQPDSDALGSQPTGDLAGDAAQAAGGAPMADAAARSGKNASGWSGDSAMRGMGRRGVETVTVYLPVPVPVYTDTGEERTFSILEAGDELEVLFEEADGEEVITEIWIIGTEGSGS